MGYDYGVGARGEGAPDYQARQAWGHQITGYVLELGESILWLFLIAQEVPGLAVWTRLPISAAEGWVDIPEVTTGLSPYPVLAGVDYVLKEFWMSWDQPAEFRLLQGGEVTCRIESDNFTPSPINAFQTGWTRSLLEDISLPGTLQLQVRNRGAKPMKGKIWVIGLRKRGSYIWW